MAELTRLEKAMSGLGKWVYVWRGRKLRIPDHLGIKKVGYTTVKTCATEAGRLFKAFETLPCYALYYMPTNQLISIDVSLEGAVSLANVYRVPLEAEATAKRLSLRKPQRYVEYDRDFFLPSSIPLFEFIRQLHAS